MVMVHIPIVDEMVMVRDERHILQDLLKDYTPMTTEHCRMLTDHHYDTYLAIGLYG